MTECLPIYFIHQLDKHFSVQYFLSRFILHAYKACNHASEFWKHSKTFTVELEILQTNLLRLWANAWQLSASSNTSHAAWKLLMDGHSNRLSCCGWPEWRPDEGRPLRPGTAGGAAWPEPRPAGGEEEPWRSWTIPSGARRWTASLWRAQAARGRQATVKIRLAGVSLVRFLLHAADHCNEKVCKNNIRAEPDDDLRALGLLAVNLQLLEDAVGLGAAVQGLQNLGFPANK